MIQLEYGINNLLEVLNDSLWELGYNMKWRYFDSSNDTSGVSTNGAKGHLQVTEDYSDPSSLFDSVFMSMSDTLNSINTLESSDQTPDDRPFDTSTNTTPVSPRDTTRYDDKQQAHVLHNY